LLKRCGRKCFGDVGWPKILAADNSQAETNAIKNTWPESGRLSRMSRVCQTVTPILTNNFQNILHRNTTELAECYSDSAIQRPENPKCNKYTKDQRDDRQKWCFAWRNESIGGHRINNRSEMAVRVLKDTVLCQESKPTTSSRY